MSTGPHSIRMGLGDVPTAVLTTVLADVEAGRLVCPLQRIDLEMAGYGRYVSALLAIIGAQGKTSVITVLRAVLAERQTQRTATVDLVWTGPKVPTASTRHTERVVLEMFEQARRSILIAGFRFDDGETLLKPLHHAMVDRGVKVAVIVDVPPSPPIRRPTPKPHPGSRLVHFLQRHWTFGPPCPAFYFDPDTASGNASGPITSMQARCIVVDEQLCLVGSANFTRRPDQRSYEVGVLVDDSDLAHLVTERWQSLIEAGGLARHL